MKKPVKKLFLRTFLGLFLALVGLVVVLLIFTFRFESRQMTVLPPYPVSISGSAADHFAASLRIPTVSPEDLSDFDSTHFEAFSQFLVETYPLADSLLDHRTFNTFSHLYHWPGRQPGLKPVIVVTHLDVVPVLDENLADWRQAPFSGRLVGDTIYGRGAIDDKNRVIATMEAVESLLAEGFVPERGWYFAVGHDEEIGGHSGAAEMAKYLRRQGVQAEYILDEGGYITSGLIPDIEPDVALIGIAEKGFLSLNLSVKVEGGHSSIPSRETAIDVLARAIVRLKDNPFPARISEPLEQFIDYVGPEMPFGNKVVFANSALFESLIISIYEAKNSGNALVRTTTAPTIVRGGVKDNVVPQVATATVNFRILPGETMASVTERVREVIADERIEVSAGPFNSEASATSSVTSAGFRTLHRTIAESYPDALVSPYLMVGITDSRHYRDLAPDIYRFSPIRITETNIKSFHGLNERLSKPEFEESIGFFVRLIRNGSLPAAE